MSTSGDRGFILQPTFRTEKGRPVILLHGILDDGHSFLVRETREQPSFFIRASDVERAAKLGAERIEASDWRTFDGHDAARILVDQPGDGRALGATLREHGVRAYESDLRFVHRFLLRRGIKGSVEIRGPWTKGKGPYAGIHRVYEDPELVSADWSPRLSVLSIDIETDPRAERLLSIALFGPGVAEVLLHCPDGLECPAGAVRLLREKELLSTLVRRVRRIDPDVLTGWNFVDFDLRVLDRLAKKYGVRLELGRGGGVLRLRESNSPFSSLDASVPGRVVLDGIELLRTSFIKMERWGLGHVARQVLGEDKLIQGSDRGEAILDAFYNDRKTFVDYNLADARLVSDIFDKLDLMALTVERSRLTGLPLPRVSGSIAAFEFRYIEELAKRRVAAPDVGHAGASTADLGGFVLEPEVGLYDNVLVCDFKSLYPSLIRTFQIDPMGLVPGAEAGTGLIDAPNGAVFRREPGILPGMLDELFPRREAAKKAGDAVASHAVKILMNSFYGVLGTSACRFYRPGLAGAITSLGRELLRWSKARIESYGFRVLYGDTDSLFILSGEAEVEAAEGLGRELAARLNGDVASYIAQRWDLESRLELEFEKLYRKLLLQSLRGGSGGARKRYAGLVGDGTGKKVEFVGLEAVRRDWTKLAKSVQRELYERLFHEQDVERYLKDAVRDLRAGRLDDQLVYVKALRKKLDEYTRTTPPHVAAARKMSRPPGRLVSYVMTRGGAEPADERRNAYDHEHYVQKQVRAVAEPVLEILGLDFDRVVGDDGQLSLF